MELAEQRSLNKRERTDSGKATQGSKVGEK